MTKDKTIIALARVIGGVALLIGSMVTGLDGVVQGTALVLLGIPVEALAKEQEPCAPTSN